jgi:hypothetical protein
VFQIGLGKVTVPLEVDQLHDAQQNFVLDRDNDLGFDLPALGLTETAVELESGMNVRQFLTVFDVSDDQRFLA